MKNFLDSKTLVKQYLILEWFDVVITRVEWFEKVLENQSLSV